MKLTSLKICMRACVLIFISTAYMHGYTVRIKNSSSVSFNPHDIHVHNTSDCHDAENDNALSPFIGSYEKGYDEWQNVVGPLHTPLYCGGTCFDWFSIKGHKFYIPNQCHDVDIEIFDDKVLLNGGEARTYGDIGGFFKDIGTAALAQLQNVVNYLETAAGSTLIWTKNLGEFIASESQAVGGLTIGAITGDEDLINENLRKAKASGIEFGIQTAKSIENQIKNISDTVRTMYENPERPNYCPFSATSKHANMPKTIDDPGVIAQDTEGLIPYIKKYAPINYLHSKELYGPIWADEYFTSPTTRIKSHATGKEYLRGKITFDKIYEVFRRCQSGNSDLYFENDDCTKYGSNPIVNKNKNGSLNVPQYVVTNETDSKIYIVYMYFYGLNGPYEIGPWENITTHDIDLPGVHFSADQVNDLRNLHESDLEHISIELDKNTKAITRIYYGSHGDREGFWMDAKSPDIQWEGTHPIVYVAHFGHGLYYKEGEWVRIFGMANDTTDKGQRWEAKLIRVYRNNDSRFDPKTMGWLYWPGRMGGHGIGAASDKGWFTKGPQDGDIGRKKGSDPLVCPNRSSNFAVPDIGYQNCLEKDISKAVIPD